MSATQIGLIACRAFGTGCAVMAAVAVGAGEPGAAVILAADAAVCFASAHIVQEVTDEAP